MLQHGLMPYLRRELTKYRLNGVRDYMQEEDRSDLCKQLTRIEDKLIKSVLEAFEHIGEHPELEQAYIGKFETAIESAREFSELRNLACGCKPQEK